MTAVARKERAVSSLTRSDFVDFQLRAWRDTESAAQVLVHSSPAGGMRKPLSVPCSPARLEELRAIVDEGWQGGTATRQAIGEVGRELAAILLPPQVFGYLVRSLERLSLGGGLRVRLCLDAGLIDLPWEYLYRPDAEEGDFPGGFLALDSRISLVREPPLVSHHAPLGRRAQRMVVAAAFWPQGEDLWMARDEYDRLMEALEPVQDVITADFVSASDSGIAGVLAQPTAIFHYVGHVDVDANGRGFLVKEVLETTYEAMFSGDTLDDLLRRAGTRLAVFSACGSGRWPFVEPLLRSGLPVLIGVQGQVTNTSAIAFCKKLYSALAAGLSVDEAVTWGRLHLLELPGYYGRESCDWGAFMVYMPTTDSVLFPPRAAPRARARQEAVRRERQQTITNVYQYIGVVHSGANVVGVAGMAERTPPTARALLPRERMPRIAGEAATPREKPSMTRTRAYTDVTVELRDLDSKANAFTVAVLPSSVGESQPVTVPYRHADLEDDLDRLDRKRLDEEDLIGLGERLAALLLPPGEVRQLFQDALKAAGQDGGVRLRLLIREPKLAQLPWEYTYLQLHQGEKDRRHFLLLNPQVSMVRHEALAEKQPALLGATPHNLRLVATTANAEGYRPLQLKRERQVLEQALRSFDVDGVTIDWEPFLESTTLDDLTQALQKGADLFHFAGHGRFKEKDVDAQTGEPVGTGQLVLVKDKESKAPHLLSAADLALRLQAAGVRLVLLGACESGRRDGVSAWTSIAPALVERGTPAVVAMQYEVLDGAAVSFSQMFYSSLAAGLSVDEAVSAARLAMLGAEIGNTEWGVPVLYMRSADGVLFPRPSEREAQTATQIRRVIQQTVGTIREGGRVVGIRMKRLEGSFEISQKADTVEGEMVGAEIDNP